jgi:hypothetical protein
MSEGPGIRNVYLRTFFTNPGKRDWAKQQILSRAGELKPEVKSLLKHPRFGQDARALLKDLIRVPAVVTNAITLPENITGPLAEVFNGLKGISDSLEQLQIGWKELKGKFDTMSREATVLKGYYEGLNQAKAVSDLESQIKEVAERKADIISMASGIVEATVKINRSFNDGDELLLDVDESLVSPRQGSTSVTESNLPIEEKSAIMDFQDGMMDVVRQGRIISDNWNHANTAIKNYRRLIQETRAPEAVKFSALDGIKEAQKTLEEYEKLLEEEIKILREKADLIKKSAAALINEMEGKPARKGPPPPPIPVKKKMPPPAPMSLDVTVPPHFAPYPPPAAAATIPVDPDTPTVMPRFGVYPPKAAFQPASEPTTNPHGPQSEESAIVAGIGPYHDAPPPGPAEVITAPSALTPHLRKLAIADAKELGNLIRSINDPLQLRKKLQSIEEWLISQTYGNVFTGFARQFESTPEGELKINVLIRIQSKLSDLMNSGDREAAEHLTAFLPDDII